MMHVRPFQIVRPRPAAWPFAPLMPRAYSVIVIDPPWHWESWSDVRQDKATSKQYDVMSTDDIKALPVRLLCDDDCLVLVWATAPMLPQAMACMAAWRVAYKSNMVWRKVTATGKPRMGLGFWARTMHEQVLIGTVGKPRKIKTFPSIFDGIAREHSRKPDEFYALVDQCAAGRRADVFSRENRPGWECFGDEAGKYDGVANVAA